MIGSLEKVVARALNAELTPVFASLDTESASEEMAAAALAAATKQAGAATGACARTHAGGRARTRPNGRARAGACGDADGCADKHGREHARRRFLRMEGWWHWGFWLLVAESWRAVGMLRVGCARGLRVATSPDPGLPYLVWFFGTGYPRIVVSPVGGVGTWYAGILWSAERLLNYTYHAGYPNPALYSELSRPSDRLSTGGHYSTGTAGPHPRQRHCARSRKRSPAP